MKSVFLTGVSSGIGNALAKLLIKKGFRVWGIARRKKLLRELDKEIKNRHFFWTAADITEENFWNSIIKDFKRKKFIPDIVIFNAAINENDLENGINLDKLRQMMEVNFFSVMTGVKILSENFSGIHFIAISSTSAFKGNHHEGIGYAASKGALSIAFESLFQKHDRSKNSFSTVFLGPVKTNMIRFTKAPPLTLTPYQVADYLLGVIKNKKPFYYYPKLVFMILSIMRLLPNQYFFKVWTRLQRTYTKEETNK